MTGKHLRIKPMGDNVLGVKLEGDKSKPEPIHFRVCFPGGDVDIVRTSDNQYWVHVHVDKEADLHGPHETTGKIVDARLDIRGKHANETDCGDFNNPDLYHLAVKIETE